MKKLLLIPMLTVFAVSLTALADGNMSQNISYAASAPSASTTQIALQLSQTLLGINAVLGQIQNQHVQEDAALLVMRQQLIGFNTQLAAMGKLTATSVEQDMQNRQILQNIQQSTASIAIRVTAIQERRAQEKAVLTQLVETLRTLITLVPSLH